MIFEAYYWKRDLKRLAKDLRRRHTQRRWHHASYAALEKCVMLGFYAIRRLLAPDAFHPIRFQETVPLIKFPSRGKKISPLFWPEVDEYFDLSKPRRVQLGLRDVCNQVIHSYFFAPWFDQGRRLQGLFFCSDWKKHETVFRVELETLIRVFEEIATARQPVPLNRFAPEKNRQVMHR